MLFSALTILASVNFASAQAYTPLVQIPGVSAGAVNLSLYLVGLYDFLLSVVGIVAVMMLIIGGMRYITAAGNQAAISDAKDIITNALFGLLLAILSWVIVAEINPDVLYLKKPGGVFVDTPPTDLGACGIFDPAIPFPGLNCDCVDAPPPPGSFLAAFHEDHCDYLCKTLDYCGLDSNLSCIEVGTEDIDGQNFYEPKPTDNPPGPPLGQGGECYCYDGTHIAPVAPADCQTTCRTTGHCGWDYLVVRVNTDDIKKDDDDTKMWEFTNLDDNKMYNFFLTNDGTWGAFNVTATSRTVGLITYECAILVTARKTTLGITGDYRYIFWAARGAKIKRDGLSMEKDLASSGGYSECCQELAGPPDCDLNNGLIPGCDTLGLNCAHELFEARYTHLPESACGDCSGAVSDNDYRPSRDLICDPTVGMWR